jgi:hypothetical protein
MDEIIQEWRPRLYLRWLGPLCGSHLVATRWTASAAVLAQAQDALKTVRHAPLEEAPDRNDAVSFFFVGDISLHFLASLPAS